MEINGETYKVDGVGRVGSKTTAKRNNRCRARRYWTVFKWNDEIYDGWRKVGYQVVEGAPRFKTKTEAEKWLAERGPVELPTIN